MFYCMFLSSTDSKCRILHLPTGTHLVLPQTHTNKIKVEKENKGNSSVQRKPCDDQPRCFSCTVHTFRRRPMVLGHFPRSPAQ